jgi:hypothetical protein
MIAFEFGSTGADEISVFHRLLLVKGRKPFRLAPCPVDITLQERLLPPVPPLLPEVPELDPTDPPELMIVFDDSPQLAKIASNRRTTLEKSSFFAE